MKEGFDLTEREEVKEEKRAALGSYVAKPWIEKYKPTKAYELLAPEYQVR